MTVYEYKGAGGDPPRIPRRPPAKCGSDSGYYRHLRITCDPACDDCLDAHAAAERRRRLVAREARDPHYRGKAHGIWGQAS